MFERSLQTVLAILLCINACILTRAQCSYFSHLQLLLVIASLAPMYIFYWLSISHYWSIAEQKTKASMLVLTMYWLSVLFYRAQEFAHSLIPYKTKYEQLKEENANAVMSYEVRLTSTTVK